MEAVARTNEGIETPRRPNRMLHGAPMYHCSVLLWKQT